ncbi:MAG: hypothetical protein WEF86_01230 [Gemmatimonadota bacterium]
MRRALADPLSVVLEWQATVNADAADRLLHLVAEDVVIIGPRGVAIGREIMRHWLMRARLRSTTYDAFQKDDVVVVAQHARWHSASGDVSGEADVAARAVVADGLITEYERYDRLADALKAAGLTEKDRVRIDAGPDEEPETRRF